MSGTNTVDPEPGGRKRAKRGRDKQWMKLMETLWGQLVGGHRDTGFSHGCLTHPWALENKPNCMVHSKGVSPPGAIWLGQLLSLPASPAHGLSFCFVPQDWLRRPSSLARALARSPRFPESRSIPCFPRSVAWGGGLLERTWVSALACRRLQRLRP